jgi:hypothetical protein
VFRVRVRVRNLSLGLTPEFELQGYKISSGRANNVSSDKHSDHPIIQLPPKSPFEFGKFGTVKFKFIPQSKDELELNVNDKIYISKLFQDTWAYGRNETTGEQGTFPSTSIEMDEDTAERLIGLKNVDSIEIWEDVLASEMAYKC